MGPKSFRTADTISGRCQSMRVRSLDRSTSTAANRAKHCRNEDTVFVYDAIPRTETFDRHVVNTPVVGADNGTTCHGIHTTTRHSKPVIAIYPPSFARVSVNQSKATPIPSESAAINKVNPRRKVKLYRMGKTIASCSGDLPHHRTSSRESVKQTVRTDVSAVESNIRRSPPARITDSLTTEPRERSRRPAIAFDQNPHPSAAVAARSGRTW